MRDASNLAYARLASAVRERREKTLFTISTESMMTNASFGGHCRFGIVIKLAHAASACATPCRDCGVGPDAFGSGAQCSANFVGIPCGG